MRSDDLVPLLAARNNGAGVGFRQGVIVTWNPNTAENSVLVGDALLENLPILNTSEAAILASGDIVGILTFGSTWGIMGRFTIPGTPQAVSALSSLRTQSDQVDGAPDPVTSATMADVAKFGPELTIDVGASGRALVIVTALMTFEVPSGNAINTSGCRMGYAMSGANTASAVDLFSLYGSVRYNSAQAGGFDTDITSELGVSRVMLRENLNPGATTFTAKYRRDTAGTVTVGNRNLTVMAL